MAGIAYQHQRFREALDLVRKAVLNGPPDASAQLLLGLSAHRLGESGLAIDSINHALALNPAFAEAHSALGDALLAQDQVERAATSYQAALALNPQLFETHLSLAAAQLALGNLQASAASLQQALVLDPNNADVHSRMGALLLKQGRFDEAIAATRRALDIRPDNVQAHQEMGRAFHYKGNLADAANCYRRAIEFGSTNPLIAHALAAVTGEEVGPVPQASVVRLFDDYAPRFDAHLTGELGYVTPRLMREAVGRLRRAGPRFQHAVDLGCGTGLIGTHFRDIVAEIDGVDLSAKMLEEAQRKGIYAKLYLEDIVAWLGRAAADSRRYDLVLSADVFIYVGNLDPVFGSVRAILAGGGLFAFSVEELAQGSYALLPAGRFAHCVAYLRERAAAHGFAIELVQRIDLRREIDTVIAGTICVLKQP